MADRQEFIPFTHRFRYKAVPGLADGGCHACFYAPDAPSTSPIPLAIMIKAGGFSIGTAETIPFNQVRYLHDAGIAVLSLEHRMLPHATITDMRDDILSAYKYIQSGLNEDLRNAGSSVSVDGHQVVSIGWSAGASLSLYLASDIQADSSLPPLRAIAVSYPVTDFSFAKATLADFDKAKDTTPGLREAYDELMGEPCTAAWSPVPLGPPTGPPPAPPAGVKLPARLMYFLSTVPTDFYQSQVFRLSPPFPPDRSPLGLITSSHPPTFVVVAGGDTNVPISQSHRLTDKLKSLNVQCEQREARDMAHGMAECIKAFPPWEKDLGEEWWQTAIRPSLDFVKLRVKGAA